MLFATRHLKALKYAVLVSLASLTFSATAIDRLNEVDPEKPEESRSVAQVIIDWSCNTLSIGCSLSKEESEPSD